RGPFATTTARSHPRSGRRRVFARPGGSDADLTAAARIRAAALRRFAAAGVAATSIRDVAKAAGVSAGLVQHHYRSKNGLRRAVDAHVIERATAAFAAAAAGDGANEIALRVGRRIS